MRVYLAEEAAPPARLFLVSKGGRKGRVSDELAAASCAAVLSIYAAGYWRTRDEARHIDDAAQMRRLVRPRPATRGALIPVPDTSRVAATSVTSP